MIGPIAYIGGKNRLAAEIISLFPEHRTYVEPFAGGAQVLFHKEPSQVEILNDLDGEVVNFYRVCQWHREELVRFMQWMPASRAIHFLQRKSDPKMLTDVQRAARFLYLQKNSFGGLVRRQSFHYGVTQQPNYSPDRIEKTLKATQARLQRVQLENLPYEDILDRYDRPSTLFYLDPPYYQRFLYNHNLKDEEFITMAARLRAVKGKFILSLNDHPEVRRIFSCFEIRTTSIAYTSQRHVGKRYGELFIMNFEPPDSLVPEKRSDP